MALILMDSFDDRATAGLALKWTSLGGGTIAPSISVGNGRRSTQSLRHSFATSSVGQPLLVTPGTPVPSGATCVLGFAFRASSFSTLETLTNFDPSASSVQSNFLAVIRQGGTTQLAFRLNTNGTISAYRGQSSATLLGTTTEALTATQYHHLQFKAVIDDSSGAVTITRDGTTILSLSGIDTKHTSSATWDQVGVLRLVLAVGASTTWDLDDLYLLDGTTTSDDPRNDVLGDCRVDPILPDGVGTYNDSTPSGGAVSRYTMVDEALQNGDTDYNTFANAGEKDSYTYQGAPVAGATIYGVQVNLWHRKEDAGTATARAFTRLGGSDYYGSSLNPGTSVSCQRQVWAQKPSDSSDWTDTDVDGAEFGYEKEA